MVSDPYLFGKICAIHALSDIHAMGVSTWTCPDDNDDPSDAKSVNKSSPSITALALCVVPYSADESVTESCLLDMLSGGSDVLQDENVRLVGGHTCEGMELSCGFSIQGLIPSSTTPLFRKRGGCVGDQIILTKPLGTGALMAADMRVRMKSSWIEPAIESMLRSNGAASRMAAATAESTKRKNGKSGIHACTDVTGFGLIGHLLEMLMANEEQRQESKVPLESIAARLRLPKIPIFEGALEASCQQIYSSLQSSNLHNRRALSNHGEAINVDPIRYPLLFDPQTAGGLSTVCFSLIFVVLKHSQRLHCIVLISTRLLVLFTVPYCNGFALFCVKTIPSPT
jgi:selenide,water dikinase